MFSLPKGIPGLIDNLIRFSITMQKILPFAPQFTDIGWKLLDRQLFFYIPSEENFRVSREMSQYPGKSGCPSRNLNGRGWQV